MIILEFVISLIIFLLGVITGLILAIVVREL